MAKQNRSSDKDKLRSEFESLPLEKKFTSLFELEVLTLNEALTYAVNSPGEAFRGMADTLGRWCDRVERDVSEAFRQRSTTTDAAPGSQPPKPERPSTEPPLRDPNV
jgi:hypothetical protein